MERVASSKTLRLPLISRGSPSFLCTIFPRLQYFHLQNCRWVKNCLQYLLQFSSVHPMSVHVCPVPPQHFKQGKYFPRPVLTVHTLSLFKHLKGQLGSPVSDKKSTLSVSDRWRMTKHVRPNPSRVPEARSETLRTPQNVPAPTVSWPDDPV